MSINLQKGDRFNLTKEAPGLVKVGVGLGWDANASNTGSKFDLDASVFMIDANGKLPADGFFVYFGNLNSPDGAVKHTGDNLTGDGDGDDEAILIDLSKLDSRITEIPAVVTIYDAAARKQNFGMVNNAFIRLYNVETKAEICRYDLSEDFSRETAVEFARLYKKDGEWRFKAVAQGRNDGLNGFLQMFK